MNVCPACRERSLPKASSDQVTASACQNPKCRCAFNRDGKQVGRWSERYKEFQSFSSEGK